jgi:putative ABC transport system permease protein
MYFGLCFFRFKYLKKATMLRYHITASFKNIKRNLSFSLINISGLALGLSLVIILIVWLQFEFSFDKFHKNADRIFRVVLEFKKDKESDNFANTPAPLGEFLKKEIPEIEDFVRFGHRGRELVNHENIQYWEDIELADPSIFSIFSFKLIKGDPLTALSNHNSIIISESEAKKFFGKNDPLGQPLLLGEKRTPYVVSGVLEDIPANSQIRINLLCSFDEEKSNKGWGNANYTTYILSNERNSIDKINKKLPLVEKGVPSDNKFSIHIQPLLDIHLHSGLRSDLQTNTSISTIYIISSILVMVLLIACINYMNLATARFTKRGKEAGIRKVNGATVSDLTIQFLCESFTITLSAFVIAIFLVYLFMPVLTAVIGVPLKLETLFSPGSVISLSILIILISILAGSYPSIALSSTNPVNSIRDDLSHAKLLPAKAFRKLLVIFQFFISISLISTALIINAQLSFIKKKDLGLNTEQVIVVPIYQAKVKPVYELFKNSITGNPAIINASAAAYFPGNQGYYQNVWWEGLADEDNSNYIDWIAADPDFIKTLDIKLLKGEPPTRMPDSKGPVQYIINESALKMTGWKDPLGKMLNIVGKGEVVGIVKDFNFKSLHNAISPMALTSYPSLFDNIFIKISNNNLPGTLAFLRKTWEDLYPQYPFEFSFLNQDFNNVYRKETRYSLIITYISFFALFVSCIGLFGLVLFTVDSKIKEIGIRKVAGATTREIIIMLNVGYIRWILLAFFFACPVIIFSAGKWLQGFAYHIKPGLLILITSAVITMLVSIITVSWHTFKMASKNPVECLVHE